jgi:N-acyl-D-aspartate/D-glutamate deacylase
MSSTPASRFGLRERGALKKGVPADLVVFNPAALSSGMKYVFVNGAIALKDGELTAARAGQALR